MINCPNPSCKTANPEGADACQVCQAVLPHHYLWGVGDLVTTLQPGTLVNQRYLLKRDRIFLDTKPGMLPESLPEIPDFLLPYLHLSIYPLHVPRPYSLLRTPDKDYVLMLESSALSATATAAAGTLKEADKGPSQLPRLINQWADAPPLRQLSWLWQIAQLWDAFAAEQVAMTLIDSTLLRVDGSVVRLLELASAMPASATTRQRTDRQQTDRQQSGVPQPTLMDLARSWQPLADSAHAAVRAFLQRLCQHLELQQLTAEQLSEQLAQAMTVCGQDQQITYDLSVHTDQGPTRKRNEDACFPTNGSYVQPTSEQTKDRPQLLIVCDGIGGHQGGDIASKLAIETIKAQLQPILESGRPELTSTELSLAIETAICAANDEISAQNDQAQRQARDRMGTTLVLALVQGADVYIAHLGDSRAYRISGRNCQQVTLDDDVASRQVRLGGSLYREVLVQPGAGSLIQALGMGPSQSLRPTVQRFVIDESCVFLLCSDGLSDSDRVEQFWQRELSPLVQRSSRPQTDQAQTDQAQINQAQTEKFKSAGPRLVELANEYNGHDNVTVGLLRAQVVQASERIVPREMAAVVNADLAGEISDEMRASATRLGNTRIGKKKKTRPTTSLQSTVTMPSSNPTQNMATTATGTRIAQVKPEQGAKQQKKGGGLKIAGIALLLLGIVAGLMYALLPGLQGRWQSSGVEDSTSGESDRIKVTDLPDESVSEAEPPPPPTPLNVSDYIRIRASDQLGIRSSSAEGTPTSQMDPTLLYPSPEIGISGDPNRIPGTIPVGGIVQIMSKQTAADASSWVQIKLCSIPSGDSLSDVPAETDAPATSPTPAAPPPAGSPPAAGSPSASAPPPASTPPPANAPADRPFNTPESTDTDRPLMLSPGADGWIVESGLAEIASPINGTLQPSQKGSCNS
ncbi:MAG: protein phosphatase 2C domain-containing protein [Phormidesmis sp.]